jgi:glycosyltransferase involved in cell wall biosynthesis
VTLTVGIDAPLNEVAVTSGLGRYAIELTRALAALQDEGLPAIEYTLFVSRARPEWVADAVREHMTVETVDPSHRQTAQFDGCDVVHLTVPRQVDPDAETLFNPHDLRHVQYPEFLRPQVLEHRRRVLPAACERATMVDTFSQATKDAVVGEYDVPPARVQPVPLGPSLAGGPVADDLHTDIERAYDLPESFVLYPANTWPHKNHRRLVAALEYVADTHDTTIPLVCPGGRDDRGVAEEYRIDDLEALGSSVPVCDLGFVETDHLRALYARSRLLVYPSLYEGGGLPVVEGWQFDTPVVCSAIAPLREKGGDAAAYFDPESVSEMGETIHTVWTDAKRRERLATRGRARRERFTWERTARLYHALYRKTAGRALSACDREALRYPDDGSPESR